MVSVVRAGRLRIDIAGEGIRVNDQPVDDDGVRELIDIMRERMIRSITVTVDVELDEVLTLLDLLIAPADLNAGDGGTTEYKSANISLEFFRGLLDLDPSGERLDGGEIDISAWGDFAPEQVAAIRLVTADERIRQKIGRIQQSESSGGGSVDFIKRFFRMLASDAGTNWHSPDDLTGTLVAGLDLVHEAQTVRESTGAVPQHLFTGEPATTGSQDSVGSHLQARFRWKLLGAMFGSDTDSARTGEEVPFPTDGPAINTEDLHTLEPGRFPTELGEVITDSLSPLVELEIYTQTLAAMPVSDAGDIEKWSDVFAEIIERRPELSDALESFTSRLIKDPELLEFFQSTLLSTKVLRLLSSELVVELCVGGRADELEALLARDPDELLEAEDPGVSLALQEVLSSIRPVDVRALDVAYLLTLRGELESRWESPWGRWITKRMAETRAVGAWLKNRSATVFHPHQVPFLFSLSESVSAELRETIDELDEETLLRFLSVAKEMADVCPLGFLVTATRHRVPSVRSLAVQCLANRTDVASVGILFHRLQTCGSDGASNDELSYIFAGLEKRVDVDVQPRLKEIVSSRVGLKYAWPRDIRERAKLALRRIKKARKPGG